MENRIKVAEADRLSLGRLANAVIDAVWQRIQLSLEESDIEWNMRQIEFSVRVTAGPTSERTAMPVQPMAPNASIMSTAKSNPPQAQPNQGDVWSFSSPMSVDSHLGQITPTPSPDAQPCDAVSNSSDPSMPGDFSLAPQGRLYAQSYDVGLNTFNSMRGRSTALPNPNATEMLFYQSYNAGLDAFDFQMPHDLPQPQDHLNAQSYGVGLNAHDSPIHIPTGPLVAVSPVNHYVQSNNVDMNDLNFSMTLDPPPAPQNRVYTQSYNVGLDAFDSMMDGPTERLNVGTTATPFAQSYNVGLNVFDSESLDPPPPQNHFYAQSYNVGFNAFNTTMNMPTEPVNGNPCIQSNDAEVNVFDVSIPLDPPAIP